MTERIIGQGKPKLEMVSEFRYDYLSVSAVHVCIDAGQQRKKDTDCMVPTRSRYEEFTSNPKVKQESGAVP